MARRMIRTETVYVTRIDARNASVRRVDEPGATAPPSLVAVCSDVPIDSWAVARTPAGRKASRPISEW